MFKKKVLATSIALGILSTQFVLASEDGFIRNATLSGVIKNESAVFTQSGTSNGDTAEHGRDVFKSESSIRAFINADVGEESSMHAELRLVMDPQQVDGEKGDSYKFHQSYQQQDYLRELYVDTSAAGWLWRVGKQQVVWGTADGAKLLDIINPTDYSEMAQNSMEESRITTWMVNAEKTLDSGANLQVIVSQPRENIFAGLDRNIDTGVRANNPTNGADLTSGGHRTGHPFILLGVDSITGKENGFLNIVPDMGSISFGFWGTFQADLGNGALQGANNITVSQFAALPSCYLQFGPDCAAGGGDDAPFGATLAGYGAAGYDGANVLGGFAANYDTNLVNATSSAEWGVVTDSTFEYMGNAPFATFDTFVNAKSQYVYDMPEDYDADFSLRYKDYLNNGLNYSVNYSYQYDKNPIIDISWRNDNGEKLLTEFSTNNWIRLKDSAGNYYGSANATGGAAAAPTLRMTQTLKRAHNIGSAMDYALDTQSFGPIVLRGEFLYQKDVYQPVIDLAALSIGDLPNGLKMLKADRFKYVLGADINVLTNMMVSMQFIQDRNLDYVDDVSTAGATGTAVSGSRYTADYATMHMSNGFNKAEENKEFYSLFFSKPFGSDQQHRWNNIFMYEENGGKWNRFDVDYSFSDNLIGSLEYNAYWGDRNTQFGQFKDSSNVQLGIRYLFSDY